MFFWFVFFLCMYQKKMPLRLDAAHPEAYIVGDLKNTPQDLERPNLCIFARGRMGVDAVPRTFVVPLGPAPQTPLSGTGPGLPVSRETKLSK